MKMRVKLLIIVAVLMITIFLTLHLIVNVVFLQRFANLEKEKTQESVTRTTNLLSNELADISSSVADWAFWDDTYDFVQTRNEGYISSNLDDSVFINLRLSLMLFINTSGSIVYGETFDLGNNTERAMLPEISEEISSNPSLWNFTAADDKTEGIIILQQEPIIFSSKPILTSQNEGPAQGALIMGRCIDSSEISYLSSMLSISLTVNLFDDPQMQKDFQIARSSLSNTSPIFVEPLNADSVGGYALISDVFSKPTLILKIDLPRDIYKQGSTTVTYFIASVAVLCVVFGGAMIILLEKGMLSPLSRLTKTVKEMETKEYGLDTLHRLGNDETSILANAIKNSISRRLAAIEEMAGMVGHDLRNPLTGIKGAAYYLRTKNESKMDAKSREMLQVIEDNVEYSNKIVNDLLEYSRKIQLEYVDTTTKTLTREALRLVSIPKNIKLTDSENEIEITVDNDKMNRVFVNLIKNSIDAMPLGGLLTIRSMKAAKGVKITFSDTGDGMSKETLRNICTPLFTTKPKGMGFGLPICKRLVEAHGGSLTFESKIGKGTAATIFIPTNAKAKTKDEFLVELPSLGTHSTSTPPSSPAED